MCSDNIFGLFRVVVGWSYIITNTATVRREEGREESKKGGREEGSKQARKKGKRTRGELVLPDCILVHTFSKIVV